MGRRSHARALNAWMNGKLVGEWRLPTRGPMEFLYDDAWKRAPEARPLSLSLPLTLDPVPLKGDAVRNYFDNLLPDSDNIRARLQSRFRTDSKDAFDLLEAIGRDCVGAVQLLPPDQDPVDVFEIHADPIDEGEIERILTVTVSSTWALNIRDDEDFRISIAGAQEKTAFIWHQGQWCRPQGSTPTTHIFKLPLGLVGNRQADMRSSVENEWLCAQILAGFGLPVAACEIARFGKQKALIVERFDRRLAENGQYWLRLPQEDFCQATGLPPRLKYEADGGPGLLDIARILQNSEAREDDLRTLLTAQLLFWALAATDGHAKNFSISLLAGGRYRLTPLYDVLSAWPVTGAGENLLDRQKLKLAMALRGKNVHYRLRDIQRRHFIESAAKCGFGGDMDQIITGCSRRCATVLHEIEARLPADFPEDVFSAVAKGLTESFDRLEP